MLLLSCKGALFEFNCGKKPHHITSMADVSTYSKVQSTQERSLMHSIWHPTMFWVQMTLYSLSGNWFRALQCLYTLGYVCAVAV